MRVQKYLKAKGFIGKLIVLLIALSAIIFSLFIAKSKIGNILPAYLPAIKNKPTTTTVSLGKPLDFALYISDGFQIGIFAEDLGNVRDLEFSPGGTLLASVPNQGKIIMLPDRNHDGVADEVDTVASLLRRPHGIAFYNKQLFIAEETRVSRYVWSDQTLIGGVARLEKKLFDLPPGDQHFTRSITFDTKGNMYVSVGSTCNVCYENNPFYAAVIISDFEGKTPVVYAKGLRNAPFITFNADTGQLWGTEMGRDFLGDNVPPDEINIINEGNDYGWPFCYGNKIYDASFDTANNQNFCKETTKPIYELPAHSAPLGLTFINSSQFPEEWQGDLLVAYHGSWNRSEPTGYKVTRLTVQGNTIISSEDFISGFLQNGTAAGRPVDMVFDKSGNLYISDDKSGTIYIVSKRNR